MTTPAYGFGTQPAGTTSGGIGTPLGLPLPGTTYESVADLVAARDIDTRAQDYVVDAGTTAVPHGSITAIEQRVLLALSTRRGRLPYEREFGNDFFNLSKYPDNLLRFARSSVAIALADLIGDRLIELLGVAVDSSGSTAWEIVEWRDITTNTARTTRTRVL